MQLIGGAAGVSAVVVLYPRIAELADAAVVPHERRSAPEGALYDGAVHTQPSPTALNAQGRSPE
jgi:hypothetical protein